MDKDNLSILRSRFSLDNSHADFRKRLQEQEFEDQEIDCLILLLSEYITDFILEEISNNLNVEDTLAIDRNVFVNNLSSEDKADFIILFFEEKTGKSVDSLSKQATSEFLDKILELESEIKQTVQEHSENPERFLNQLILKKVTSNE